MRKINEIFLQLARRGLSYGYSGCFLCVFSGCNLKCSFCDTQHEEGVLMSDEEILAEVGKYPAVTVILTGGSSLRSGLTVNLWIVCTRRESMSALKQTVPIRCRII